MIRLVLCTLLAVLGAALLVACGDADDPVDGAAAATLSETFAATSKLESAKLAASFRFEPDGPVALAGPIVIRASGPFARPATTGALPRLHLAIGGSLGGRPIRAGVLSTGKRGYLELGGTTYRVGTELEDALGKALTGGKGGGFAPLGLDPSAWVVKARTQGTERVAGVETERIAGEIDVQRLLADVAKLLSGSGADGFLTPKLRTQIADSVKSSRVEVWTGVQDRILRQLAIAVDFAFDDKADHPMGLDGGRMNLRLTLDAVNETPVEVKAPKGARPLSDLAAGLGGLLGGLGGGTGGAARGAGGEAFLKCLESAKGETADIARCGSELSPSGP